MVNLSQNLKHTEILGVVSKAAVNLGYPVYLVGGFVRDMVMDKTSKDIDLVCVGSGIKLAREVSRLSEKPTKVNVFKNFGTAMLNCNGYELEFVGARKESYRRDSRKPIVEDGTLDDDLQRRDFTINAMAISLNQEDYGTLLDPFDGIQDIQKKIIRTPLDPEITFSDDPLRMMRAIRFAAQLEFDIDADTFQAMTNNASRLKNCQQGAYHRGA